MRHFILLITFLSASCVSSISSGCTTPDHRPGECKNFSDCYTIPFQRNFFRTMEQLNYLRKSICGFENKDPMICCPVTTTFAFQSTTPGGISSDCSPSYLPPNPDSRCCGVHGSSFKILGGSVVDIYEYPWLALLEYRDIDTREKNTKCGGSLISGRYVLTAAQCLDAARTNLPESVRLGEYDTLTENDCVEEVDDTITCNNGSVSIPIQEFVVHNAFKRGQYPKNDIALLRLARLVTFNEFIKPICLPPFDRAIPNDLYLAGWGATAEGIKSSIKLHEKLPYINLTHCNIYYDELDKSQICAGGEIGVDACKGDSGAPLMGYIGAHYEVIGMVSYGSLPCGYHYPGVYTNVIEHLDWIKNNIRE